MSEVSIGCPSGLAPPTGRQGAADPRAFVREGVGDGHRLELSVTGARCAGCISKIEGALLSLPGVTSARLNLSTGKLAIAWEGGLDPRALTDTVASLGFGVTPFDPAAARRTDDAVGRDLLRCLAVAGFAMANIMLLSVSIWSATDGEMGRGTRDLLHLISGLIAIPAAFYAGRPFFSSAWAALKQQRANMDVPISLAVILALTISLVESLRGGHEAYFDAAVMLLFFLLIGRYLDHQLRRRARSAAADLIAMQAVTATKFDENGHAVAVAAQDIAVGDLLSIAPGDRIPTDGTVVTGASDLDVSLLTGETVPETVAEGGAVRSGTVNLSHPLTVRVTARADDSFVAELTRLIEAGQQRQGIFVRLADKAAKAYVPIVHTLAATTFLGWWLVGGIGVRESLLIAIALLIITCPCALGLATPAVQVVTTGRLFRKGILVKSGDALERLAKVTHMVFDKTGTLTTGALVWTNPDALDDETRAAVARVARASRHPIARAIAGAMGPGPVAAAVEEVPGKGCQAEVDGRMVRLGRADFAMVSDSVVASAPEATGPSAWVRFGAGPATLLQFTDDIRPEAAGTLTELARQGIEVSLLSGDRQNAVQDLAARVGIDAWGAEQSPAAKAQRVEALTDKGETVAMVGDGLNDTPALAYAAVSLSPGSAADAAQSGADIVFQGKSLAPVSAAVLGARSARARILQNFGIAAVYNAIAAPVAMAGFVTPLIAALAMSGSSLVVTLNALRPQRGLMNDRDTQDLSARQQREVLAE